MLAAMTFASFFGLTEYLGLGDKAEAYFNCTDPAFFVTRDENQLTGDKHLTLKGTINTPQQGYSYRFQFVNADGLYADGVISVGQPVSRDKRFGRGLPSIQQVQVEQKFNVPQSVRMLRIRVEGLTPMPTSFACDITQTPTN
jgi:hypothetical protein